MCTKTKHMLLMQKNKGIWIFTRNLPNKRIHFRKVKVTKSIYRGRRLNRWKPNNNEQITTNKYEHPNEIPNILKTKLREDINDKRDVRQREGMHNEPNAGAVLLKSILQWRPWIPAIGANRVKKRLNQNALHRRRILAVPEPILHRRYQRLACNRWNYTHCQHQTKNGRLKIHLFVTNFIFLFLLVMRKKLYNSSDAAKKWSVRSISGE